jgi:hypothetical protein
MNRIERIGARGFSLLMRLYPAGFRDTFGVEMLGVFEEKLADGRDAGVGSRIGLVLNELADLTLRALAQRAMGRKGKEYPMTASARRVRFLVILSPVLLTVFLAIVNPRYLARIFTDSLGWEMIAALVLGLCICLLVWSASIPADSGRRFGEELALAFLVLTMDLTIMLGPALVMAFGYGSPSGAGRDYGVTLRWIVLAIVGLLAIVSTAMGIGKFRSIKDKSQV